jgi:hypothetical protein
LTDAGTILTDFRRYADLIRASLPPARSFEAQAESATAIQVERGIVYPNVLLDPAGVSSASVNRLIEIAGSERMSSSAVVDRTGHHRPVYRGLLIYSWLQAFSLAYETLSRAEFGRWEEGLRPWCDLMEAELGEIEWPTNGPMPAGRGSSATESAWMALGLHIAGKVFVRDAWTDLASDTFGRLVKAQNALSNADFRLPIENAPIDNRQSAIGNSRGPFLLAGPSDNPETHAYHELVLLHAAASYAVQAEDRTVAAAVSRNAEYHQESTQPDHATTQPWGLFAFIWNTKTRPLADQVLHAATPSDSEISLMLLADALYCLKLFI